MTRQKGPTIVRLDFNSHSLGLDQVTEVISIRNLSYCLLQPRHIHWRIQGRGAYRVMPPPPPKGDKRGNCHNKIMTTDSVFCHLAWRKCRTVTAVSQHHSAELCATAPVTDTAADDHSSRQSGSSAAPLHWPDVSCLPTGRVPS